MKIMKRENSHFLSQKITKRRRNRRLIPFMIVFLFVTIIGFTTGSLISYANAKTQNSESGKTAYKYYTSIQIAKGDSLYSIAERYISKEYKNTEMYVHEMMQMNSLDDETIHAGQFLIIPYYSEEIK